MSRDATGDARWTHLMNAAFHLQQVEGLPAPERHRALRESVDSALEAFSGAEPLEDYEGYTVRRMLLAVRGALG